MKKKEIQKILELHEKYLKNEEGGVRADLRGAYLKGANLREVNLSGAELCGANLKGANLERADFEWANLEGANLMEANLSFARLYEANLVGVNLEGAILEGADLYEENLEKARFSPPIVFFNGSRHTAYHYRGNIKIGCKCRSVEYWVENYKTIGKMATYSDKDIEEYGEFIIKMSKNEEGE